jgi:hypothetical protein
MALEGEEADQIRPNQIMFRKEGSNWKNIPIAIQKKKKAECSLLLQGVN